MMLVREKKFPSAGYSNFLCFFLLVFLVFFLGVVIFSGKVFLVIPWEMMESPYVVDEFDYLMSPANE